MATHFIADLHLSGERPETIRLLLDYLGGRAREAEALYILGDLFEAWLGDDLILPEYPQVLEALKALNDSSTPVYVMHGNRDFLLGERFEQMSGCRLIDDPLVIDLHGTPTLLMHGDLLCSDDHAYMAMRQQLRDPQWIDAFLEKSAQERIAFARELRERSMKETGDKAESIMDVNPQTVVDYLQRYGVAQLIHGHTHRPGKHRHVLSNGEATRYVLPDWNPGAELLVCDAQGCDNESLH